MSTNDEEITDAPADVTNDAVADLANAKAEAENKPDAPVSEPEAQSDPTPEAEGTMPDATLTNIPEHDLDWYKKAYDNSTKEALRLKGELDKKVDTPPPPVITPPVDDGVPTA